MSGKIALLWAIGMLPFSQMAEAQRHIYRSYTKSDGLPSDYVFHITQAPTGEMWFGTERGAARYDGNQFRTFTTEDGLPHNFVYAIHVDSRGRTWFGTASPVPVYLRHGRIESPAIDWGGTSGIYDITETASGVILFRFPNGLGLMDGDRYRFHPITLNTTKESRIQAEPRGSFILTDSRHVLRGWPQPDLSLRFDTLLRHDQSSNFMSAVLSEEGDLYTHIFNHITHHRLVDDEARLIARHPVPLAGWLTIRNGPNGSELIAGTRSHGLKVITSDGSVRPLQTDQSKDRGHVSALHIDYEGNLWAAFLGEGVEKISNWNSLRLNRQSGLYEDNIWRLKLSEERLYAMSKTGLEVIANTSLERIGSLPIRTNVRGFQRDGDRMLIAMMTDLRGYRWPASFGAPLGPELFHLDVGEGINDIGVGSDGSVWVATAGTWVYRRHRDGRVDRHPAENGAERIVVAGEDAWWLTSDDGAHRFRDGQVVSFRHETGQLPSNTVTSLAVVNGTTLIGTRRGLVRLDSTDQATWFSPADGLIGISVEAVFRRDSASAWVATREHLHIWSADGIRSVSSLATLRTELAAAHWHEFSAKLGRWYMATPNGIVVVDLTTPTLNIPPPKVSISGFRVDEAYYPTWMADALRHTGATSSLEITFHGLTFIEESATRYVVKLDGVDEQWSQPQRANTVRYANLPPGTYTFRVKALNVENIPSAAEATLRITLLPPFWMHPATRILAALTVLVVLVAFTRWRIHVFQQEVVRRNEQRQFEAIQRIGASISHDIRNTVFSLNLLAKNLELRFNNPEFRKDAIETIESSLNYLSKLVDQLQQRPARHSSDHREIPLRPFTDAILKRLAPTAPSVRFVNELAEGATLRTDPDALGRILENLMRNAAEAMGSGGVIRIHGSADAGWQTLSVTDNGPGMTTEFVRTRLFRPFQSTKTKGLGIGLYTCQEMARELGGRIEVESEPGTGTRFRILLPIKTD